ncbi:carotenoid 1,2-hydratase [Piscinibacter sp. Jin2]|uniref:Carotenoid 1,2-hydratase n=1 Tax=Aquariibacter lacus TaxID=2801332 RepID=A0A9X0XBQ9_9BURK|nr:carotenoid 1,2-hydratase [Piscinibacter lacus]MBL0719277.1 carotenoid 1,2-hydratase [Piscinibacter lacus]
MTLIAFVGSVFSPYYARARGRSGLADPENHCALNVSLYGPARRWTMTERGRGQVRRDVQQFQIGPSQMRWTGQALEIDIDERAVPLPQRVRGRVRLWPRALSPQLWPLDRAGRHGWGPIAPSARVELSLDAPALSWSGEGYLDSNEGEEPIDRPFLQWDWSRAHLSGGRSAVLYELEERDHSQRLLALAFDRHGQAQPFTAPGPQRLAASPIWRMPRMIRGEASATARVEQTLEDTPFYSRSLVQTRLLGENVTAFHESLSLPRLVHGATQWMLPWRMPRRA